MRIYARADEFDTRLQDEVSGHPLPREVKLVARRPHVGAARGQGVRLRGRVIRRAARNLRRADVRMPVEYSDPAALS
jgi:hypothetical protein